MASFDPAGNTITKAVAQGSNASGISSFIPELWSDEIIAAYKSNLVLANLVKKMPMKGKKGDTLHVPKPVRGAANAKVAETQVTLNAIDSDVLTILIDKHYEYSTLIEDIADVQAMNSLRKFYTDDAGYQLAKQVDNDLFDLATALDGGAVVARASQTPADFVQAGKIFMVNGTGGITDYAEDDLATTDVLNDQAIRDLIQEMDDADVPQNGRVLVIPPSAVNTLRGIERYVSSDFVEGRTVMNGKIGTLYGVEVYVSSNCPVIETLAQNGQATNPTAGKLGMMFQKDSLILAEQMGVRSQTQYKQEYLANLFTADMLYGTQVYRPEGAFGIVVPA